MNATVADITKKSTSCSCSPKSSVLAVPVVVYLSTSNPGSNAGVHQGMKLLMLHINNRPSTQYTPYSELATWYYVLRLP